MSLPQLRQAVIAHEFGHAMGLKHNINMFSIMCQLDRRLVIGPSADDCNGINYLYN